MEIVARKEKSTLARVFFALGSAFSRPERIPIPTRREKILLIAADGSVRSHCNVLLVGDTCAICGVRPSWRDEP